MSSLSIPVSARDGDYTIEVARGLRTRLGAALDAAGLAGTRILVTSPRVWAAQGRFVKSAGAGSRRVVVPDGERAKTMRTVARVHDALVAARADRGAIVVAVGGGVIGDLVGFAAATYLRGVRLVQVPTTLMAQVDSAIGGKVGVNHPRGKNLIGAFHAPRRVLVDPDALATLPAREFRAGLYEVVKYGVIASEPLLDLLDTRLDEVRLQRGDALAEVVAACCRIKAGVVSADEREGGLRRILNFGHTAGHALEAASGYGRLRHGEAVALGMRVALALGVARGVTAPDLAVRVGALLDRLGPVPSVAGLSRADVLAAIGRDKKIVNRTLHFIAATTAGATTTLTDVTPAELRQALATIGIRR
ncbi:MAG: 3-dehydroquinate synthase [Vicinamibacterales bacterium]